MKVLQDIAPQLNENTKAAKRRNFFTGDDTLQLLLKEHLDEPFLAYATEQLEAFGELCANEIDERARHNDRDGQPVLQRYDRYGEEVSEVWVNEGYRQTAKQSYDTGIVGYVHKEIPALGRKGNYTYSFAQGYLLSQAEPGFYCPVTLTMATAYLLDHYADDRLKERLLPHVCSTGEVPLYEGATFLTERQGGSDVGANLVKAIKAEDASDAYRLYGEKYFASNAGRCGVAMVLARIEGAPAGSRGLTLFAVPWRLEDGRPNGLRIRRLKDKLGVRAVPSGEVEFDGALAYVVGDPARGFIYMMEALNLSRICNAVASVGIMRRALTEAREYASRREAFGKRLTEFPMVRDTLGKLTAKLHVELAAMFDLIKLYEKVTEGTASEREVILHRLYIAIMKKETAEQAIHFAHEAIEMHGGNGYIEDFVTPRLLRDAQVLTVWEGTANILGLELVRLVHKIAAHRLFVGEMQRRLLPLAEGAMKQLVTSKLDELAAQLNDFAGYDEALQTYEAKGLAQRMAWLYESVVAIEWAERYGGKYALLAEIYLEQTWGLRKMGEPMKTVAYFEKIS
ncbi:acyl-CoA dehydrogenase family protein [Brevibacillus composti]|uniref:Acyl-CoA dehydrogenase family protein n=1 Tax=Brevibacillus composti TaxID=2796470 RepID=A0A7T5ENC7_9BACL|nr:acyl-CoA dehydrogenase family protein [Brevibacillus composti]QQE75784.1 acyl-CoA dehydrogenase family protein [Brevibacillus composti]QUO42810.1 acyl-CoA dehydrogenase family protein [Brevibacillus composti]